MKQKLTSVVIIFSATFCLVAYNNPGTLFSSYEE